MKPKMTIISSWVCRIFKPLHKNRRTGRLTDRQIKKETRKKEYIFFWHILILQERNKILKKKMYFNPPYTNQQDNFFTLCLVWFITQHNVLHILKFSRQSFIKMTFYYCVEHSPFINNNFIGFLYILYIFTQLQIII